MIYAVNKRTKEHVAYPFYERVDEEHRALDWNIVQADPGGWIGWHGGDCPLPDGFRCDVIHRSGFSSLNRPADGWAWGRDYEGDDIIAYRPILDAGEPEQPRCEYCDGTGDVHSPDGEWRGECPVCEPEPPAWGGHVPPVGAYVEYPTGRGVVKLPPDRDGVTVVEDDGSKCADEAGTYKRVAACTCEPILSEEDRAIEAMRDAIDNPILIPDCVYKGIYDAIRDGKVPGVKLTGGE